MLRKSIGDFFRNPLITLPNIIIGLIGLLITKIFLNDEYLKQLTNEGQITNYQTISPEVAKLFSYVLLLMIFFFFITPFISAWYNLMCKSAINNEKIHFKGSLIASIKYYWRLLGILVLKIVIFIGLAVIFIIAMMPLSVSISANPERIPPAFVILVILFVIVAVVLGIILLPIESLLIYDNMNITEAISKGFKFGWRNFLNIFAVSLLIGIVGLIINKLLYNFPTLSTILTAYIGLFLTVYMMNLYKNSKTLPLPLIETPPEVDNKYIDEENADTENKNDDKNNFII